MRRSVVALAALLALASPAWAHGDTGVIELLEAEQVGAGEVRYVIRLTYANDGDPVPDAEVDIEVAGGASQPMAHDHDGRYAATIALPGEGTHTVTFRVEEPAATLEHRQVVEAPTTTAAAPGDDGGSATITGQTATEPVADDEPTGWWLAVVVGAFAALVTVVATAFLRGRRPRR